MAPWSWLHPDSANSSRFLVTRQIARLPPAKSAGIRPLRPILESDHAQWSERTDWWPPMPSIARPCATRKRWHRHSGGRARAVALLQSDAYWDAPATAGATPPTIHPRRRIRWSCDCLVCVVVRVWLVLLGSYPLFYQVIRIGTKVEFFDDVSFLLTRLNGRA